jgi:hypothetical protein
MILIDNELSEPARSAARAANADASCFRGLGRDRRLVGFARALGGFEEHSTKATKAVLSALLRKGVGRILLTNRNHVRAANRVRECTGARPYIHPEDAAYAKAQGAVLDSELHAGERMGVLEDRNITSIGGKGKCHSPVGIFGKQW